MVYRNYSIRTINLREDHLAEFARWLQARGIAQSGQVTPRLLEEYHRWLHAFRKANGQPRSVLNQYQRIHAVRCLFRFLTKSGRIPFNPAADLELPRLGKPLPKRVLAEQEVERLLAQPDLSRFDGIRDRAILETLFATAIRRAELANLRIGDIDLVSQTLIVRAGKNKRDRVVPVSDRAVAWLDRYLSGARWMFKPDLDDGTLFLTRFKEPIGLKWLTQMVGQYLACAGLPRLGGCHIFRHTAATLMLDKGADLRFIQEMLGHSSIETTQRYTRVSIASLRRVYEQTHPSATGGPVSTASQVSKPPARQSDLFE
jgi:integrase/recombinase XerD